MFNYETEIGPSAPHCIRRLDYEGPTKYKSGDGVTGQNQEGKKENLHRRRKNTQSSQGGGAVCFYEIQISWRRYLENSGDINKSCTVS